MNDKTVQLIGSLVEQNVRDAAFTTNALIASVEDQRDYMARAFLKLYESLQYIPDFARSVTVDLALQDGYVAYDQAWQYLNPGVIKE